VWGSLKGQSPVKIITNGKYKQSSKPLPKPFAKENQKRKNQRNVSRETFGNDFRFCNKSATVKETNAFPLFFHFISLLCYNIGIQNRT